MTFGSERVDFIKVASSTSERLNGLNDTLNGLGIELLRLLMAGLRSRRGPGLNFSVW